MWTRLGELITARGAQQDLYNQDRQVVVTVSGMNNVEVAKVTSQIEELLKSLDRKAA